MVAKLTCPFCKLRYVKGKKNEGKQALYNHLETEHNEDLCGLPAAQVYFNYRNHYKLDKGNGKSVISGKPTKFNLATERYERFLPEEAKLYREMFLSRMRKVYGRDTLLDLPEQQKKMLANRGISGTYEFLNGEKKLYTGSYEKDFLQYLDLVMNWDPSDILTPAPQIFPYEVDGKTHFHIPDVYIQSLNLLVNIKSSSNKFYRLRDIEVEELQDSLIEKSNFRYLKIMEKDYREFNKLVEQSKEI